MSDLNTFRNKLEKLLSAHRSRLRESDLREATRKCRDEIYSDAIRFGGSLEDSFFNFVTSDSTTVFTFFETEFGVYIIDAAEYQIITQTDGFSMSDIEECKMLLEKEYGKVTPDIRISRSLAELWLS